MDTAARRFTWYYARCQLRLKYRYTFLGFGWNFIEPGLYLIVLSVIFSFVNRMNLSDYAVFLFGALLPWRYFERSVNSCMDSITGGDWLLKKMYVSSLTLPLTRWLVASVEFLISLVVLFLILFFLKPDWTVHVAILPLSMIPWAMLALGVGLVCAVLFTFFRDIRPIVQLALMLAFFASPILFRPDLFPPDSIQARLLRFHPLTYFAALFQKPVYYETWPSPLDWSISFAMGMISLLAGYVLFRKYRGVFYFYI
jgi:homopolymeric O-antigen transport system permease protein